MKRTLLSAIVAAMIGANADATILTIPVVTMTIQRGTGDSYPEIRRIPAATDQKALVWGSTTAECAGDSASVEIPANQAPAGNYTLWVSQSYSDPGAISGFTGLRIDVNGKRFDKILGPAGELYYTTSLEKFYWTPVAIGTFHGGRITLTRDASGGGYVATDVMVLTDDPKWRPKNYKSIDQSPKTIAAFAGPPITLPGKRNAASEFFKVEAEEMAIDRVGGSGAYPNVEDDQDRWSQASGGRVVTWNCVIDETEAKKSLSWTFPPLPVRPWRLRLRLAHGLPEKDVALGYPPAKKDTGLFIVVDGKTYGSIQHPPEAKKFNDFFWWTVDLRGFRGGPVKIIRKTGGGWLFVDALILTRQDEKRAKGTLPK